MAMAAHNDEGTNTRHATGRRPCRPARTDVLLSHPSLSGSPADDARVVAAAAGPDAAAVAAVAAAVASQAGPVQPP